MVIICLFDISRDETLVSMRTCLPVCVCVCVCAYCGVAEIAIECHQSLDAFLVHAQPRLEGLAYEGNVQVNRLRIKAILGPICL